MTEGSEAVPFPVPRGMASMLGSKLGIWARGLSFGARSQSSAHVLPNTVGFTYLTTRAVSY